MKDYYHKYYDYFEVGEKITSGGRQITDAEPRLLIGIIGATHPLHIDPVYCATREGVGTPIAQGSLILGFIDGSFYDFGCPGGEVVVIPDGYDKIRFLKPIHIGDVVHVEFEVLAKTEINEKYGRVTVGATVYNQDASVMLYAIEHFKIEKEGA